MSYDLGFVSASDCCSEEDFRQYFARRSFYELRANQAFYENPNTGVYFSFEWPTPEATGAESLTAMMQVNLFRPNFFGREATLEIAAFAALFSLAVIDCQTGETADPFDPDAFVAAYRKANRWAVGAMLKQQESGATEVLTLPESVLTEIWHWNYCWAERYAELDKNLYIARIMLLKTADKVMSAQVWSDGFPTILARTEVIVIYRQQLAARRFLIGTRKADTAILPFNEVEPWLRKYGRQWEEGGYRPEPWGRPPADLAAFIRSLPAAPPATGVRFDEVLDAENVAAAE